MNQHTPGPWKAEPPRFGYQTIRQDPKDWSGHGYQLICTVPQSPKGTPYGEMFRANARLIAAVPDLLDALTKLSDEVLGSLPLMEPLARREFGNANYIILIQRAEEARAAIAKARG